MYKRNNGRFCTLHKWLSVSISLRVTLESSDSKVGHFENKYKITYGCVWVLSFSLRNTIWTIGYVNEASYVRSKTAENQPPLSNLAHLYNKYLCWNSYSRYASFCRSKSVCVDIVPEKVCCTLKDELLLHQLCKSFLL